MTVISMIVSDPNVSEMPQMGKWLKLLMYAVGTLIGFTIAYWIYILLLKNNSNYKVTLIINMVIGMSIEALLLTIIYLIAGKTNVWVSGIAGFIGFGSLGALNWRYLEVPQSDKIKVSVFTGILFILTLF